MTTARSCGLRIAIPNEDARAVHLLPRGAKTPPPAWSRVLNDSALRASLAAAGQDAGAWGMGALMPRRMELYALPPRSQDQPVGSPTRA